MELYYAPGSCAFASLVACCEAKASFSAHRIVLAENEQKAAWFTAISPHGRVPVLVTDEVAVSETIAVLTLIAKRYPSASLLPVEDPLALAKAYEFMAWLASSGHVTIAQLWRGERFSDDPATREELKTAAHPRLLKVFQEIEGRIAGPWAMPSGYSVVDPYLGVFFRWAQRTGTDTAQFPRWGQHFVELVKRAAVQQAMSIENGPEKLTRVENGLPNEATTMA